MNSVSWESYSYRNCKLDFYRAHKIEVAETSLFTGAQPKQNRQAEGQDPKSQGRRQSDGYGGWCLELRLGGRYEEEDESK